VSGTAIPSFYAACSFPNDRCGVFYMGGQAPRITLSKAGATAYEVRGYYGTVVTSGSMSGTTCTPTAPVGGWMPGWYRIYFTGPETDPTLGPGYAATNFVVLRPDPRFPPMPSPAVSGRGGNEVCDVVAKAVLGLGTSRQIIATYSDPTLGGSPHDVDSIASAQINVLLSRTYYHAPDAQYLDPVRERAMWVSTAQPCADGINVAGATSGTFLRVYVASGAVNSANLYISSGPGTLAGSKVVVAYPDSGTVVETFDDLLSGSAAETAINASSQYIRAFSKGAAAAATTSPTAVGRAYWDGIVQTVQALWPDIKHYEFTNEPVPSAETVHQARLFTAAVHAGNAAAKSMGPCTVEIGMIKHFLQAGGGDVIDVLSFHDYNTVTLGNIAAGRTDIEKLIAVLTQYGVEGKERWQTEAGAAFTGVYGVHHPRRARVKMIHTLLWEQYGVPREKNVYWYDRGHGFWSFPMFWKNEDESVSADAVLHRVLAEETFGMLHTSRLQFGRWGDAMMLGSVYAGAAGQCVVLVAASHMDGLTATLTVPGAPATVTVVDGFGNETTTPVVGGRVTVAVHEVPTYVRLPLGVTPSVWTISDWPPIGLSGQGESAAHLATAAGSGDALRVRAVNDGGWITRYGSSGSEFYEGADLIGDTLTLTWERAARVDRVLIWNMPPWQLGNVLWDFDIQTSADGISWVTRKTVTKPTPSSFLFATSSTNVWCTRETYWDEQWIWDVKLDAPVTAKALRILMRGTSRGGEPDDAALAAGGQGWPGNRIVLQEVAVLCDANTQPQVVRAETP